MIWDFWQCWFLHGSGGFMDIESGGPGLVDFWRRNLNCNFWVLAFWIEIRIPWFEISGFRGVWMCEMCVGNLFLVANFGLDCPENLKRALGEQGGQSIGNRRGRRPGPSLWISRVRTLLARWMTEKWLKHELDIHRCAKVIWYEPRCTRRKYHGGRVFCNRLHK